MFPQLLKNNKSSAVDSLLTRLTKLLFNNKDAHLSKADCLTTKQSLIDKEIKDITTNLIKKAPYYPGSVNNFYVTVELIEDTLTLTLSDDLKRFINWYDVKVGGWDWEGDTFSPPVKELFDSQAAEEKLERLFKARRELLVGIQRYATIPDSMLDDFVENTHGVTNMLNSQTKSFLEYWKNKYRDLFENNWDFGIEISNKGSFIPGMGQMFISIELTPDLEDFLKGN